MYEKAIIVSILFIAMCPKKIGFKKQIKNVIFPIFLLNSSLEIFDIPTKVNTEKKKLIE